MGPQGPIVVQLLPARDSVLRGAPGQLLAQPVKFRALDAATLQPIAGAEVVWTVTGTNGRVDQPVAATGSDGSFTAQWVLGTRAYETQRLRADVSLSGRTAFAQVRAVAVPSQVVALKLVTDTTPVLAGTARALQAYATDPYGNRFVPQGLRYASLDTSVVTVDTLGTLRGTQAGIGRVQVAVNALADTGAVRVIQILQSIKVDHDTLHFWALRQVDTLKVTLIDTQGLPIPGLLPTVTLGDTALASFSLRAGRPLTVTSAKNGTTTILLSGGGVTKSVVVQIQQIPALLQAAAAYPTAIFAAAAGSLVPLSCQVWDVKGNPIAMDPTVTGSATGNVAGTHCSDLKVQRSGLDTVRLAAGSAVAAVPVVVALPPVVTGPALGTLVDLSALPPGEAWAPSARRNSRGQLEVYFGYATYDTSTNQAHEDLRRIVSTDNGVTFADDGMVLQHDATDCSLTGYGFENMVIVPRQEAGGWRMFVSAGSFTCYGWQVFSAVSTDERTWTLETGVRVAAGSGPPVKAGPDPYWPTGEGIIVDQLPSGEWRMMLGAYEHLTPAEDKFQIMEWNSPDQINWTYGHTVLSTRQMPAAGAGTVYSPTIRQVAPGLWRMIFAGDNRFGTGWRGKLWSAVSTDKETWQLEGQLMGSDITSLFYASLVDDRLVFIREDDANGGSPQLAIATVTMP
jgi:hypothetical protein